MSSGSALSESTSYACAGVGGTAVTTTTRPPLPAASATRRSARRAACDPSYPSTTVRGAADAHAACGRGRLLSQSAGRRSSVNAGTASRAAAERRGVEEPGGAETGIPPPPPPLLPPAPRRRRPLAPPGGPHTRPAVADT